MTIQYHWDYAKQRAVAERNLAITAAGASVAAMHAERAKRYFGRRAARSPDGALAPTERDAGDTIGVDPTTP